jgi:hypothetical protein
MRPMPLAIAEYLRHLATRCSRMSRDCHDQVVSKELEIVSVELVEKAEALEAEYAIPGSSGDGTADLPSTDVISANDDDVK